LLLLLLLLLLSTKASSNTVGYWATLPLKLKAVSLCEARQRRVSPVLTTLRRYAGSSALLCLYHHHPRCASSMGFQSTSATNDHAVVQYIHSYCTMMCVAWEPSSYRTTRLALPLLKSIQRQAQQLTTHGDHAEPTVRIKTGTTGIEDTGPKMHDVDRELSTPKEY
jgi:hypothetical protein